MIKNLNRTIVEPFGIPSKTSKRNESFNKSGDINRERFRENLKTPLMEKGLVFMLTVSSFWFFAFLYFILYVFT